MMSPQHRMTCIMDQIHAALRDLKRPFDIKEAHKIIREQSKVDIQTAAQLFVIMLIMGYVNEEDEKYSATVHKCIEEISNWEDG